MTKSILKRLANFILIAALLPLNVAQAAEKSPFDFAKRVCGKILGNVMGVSSDRDLTRIQDSRDLVELLKEWRKKSLNAEEKEIRASSIITLMKKTKDARAIYEGFESLRQLDLPAISTDAFNEILDIFKSNGIRFIEIQLSTQMEQNGPYNLYSRSQILEFYEGFKKLPFSDVQKKEIDVYLVSSLMTDFAGVFGVIQQSGHLFPYDKMDPKIPYGERGTRAGEEPPNGSLGPYNIYILIRRWPEFAKGEVLDEVFRRLSWRSMSDVEYKRRPQHSKKDFITTLWPTALEEAEKQFNQTFPEIRVWLSKLK